MNKETFDSLQQYLKLFELVGSLGLLGAIIYSIWRTGSLHLLRVRLWSLLHGKDEISDEEIRSFIGGRTSLMAFRWVSGITARTIDHAKRIVSWARDNDEDVYSIAVAGPYFDREELRLKEPLPRIRPRGITTLVCGTVALILFFATVPILSTRAYLKIRDTGLWFSASSTDVHEAGPSFLSSSRPFFIRPADSQPLTLEMCKTNKIPADAFGRAQSAVLCEWLTSADKDKLLAGYIKDQEKPVFVIVGLLGYFFVLAIVSTVRLQAAWNMKTRLDSRGKQLTLGFDADEPAVEG